MNILDNVLTYIRRILKTFSNDQISNPLLIDYVNRFVINDLDARIQLFELKRKYQFQTVPGVEKYNIPLYDVQTQNGENINYYPVYQGFLNPAYINGVQVSLFTKKNTFYNYFPNIIQNSTDLATGDGSTVNFDLQVPIIGANSTPINNPVQSLSRGHVDISGVIATGSNIDPPRS